MPTLSEIEEQFLEILGPDTQPIAVFLLPPGAQPSFAGFEPLKGHRYCQLRRRGRRGEAVRLEPNDPACPATSPAFGFRSLPENLASGRALVGFGIVSEPATGRRMFEGMARLDEGAIASLAACPLGRAPRLPDVVVVEGPTESLMWIALAELNVGGGQRLRADSAVLQATCVDATLIPYLEQRLNFCLGCYGCRDATDIATGETVVGFPGERLEPIVAALEHLAARAIPRSRQKGAYSKLTSRSTGVGA